MTDLPVSITHFTEDPRTALQPVINALQANKQLNITLDIFDWGEALQAYNRYITQQHGPAVSQIGTTWMGSLVPQNALRPFNPREIALFEGSNAFFPSAWRSTRYQNSRETYAIPWLTDTNLIYYRKDVLKKAGLNEFTSFATLEQLPQTLTALQTYGHPMPWISHSGVRSLGMIHHISNWIWGMGGAYMAPDGRQVAFNSPKARAGIRMYFELQRFIPTTAYGLSDYDAALRYFNGEAAVVLASADFIEKLEHFPPEVRENTAVAVPPGIPFVGGSNWVIWTHTPVRLEQAALDFIAAICSTEAQIRLHNETGVLPARLDALTQNIHKPHYPVVWKTLQKGWPFPSTRLWGMIEHRLADAFFIISNALLANPDADIEMLLDEQLTPLERHLNITLSI
ncbi:MAG: extracellular solute-binding protein [Anaerolineales bacterium]|nr:extracellular solute-binding protein [Anaerolineales bacterium]